MEKSKNEAPKKTMIFIVGTSRSGTTLMRQILSKHSNVYISKETHYFDDLRVKMSGREQKPLSSQEIQVTEDYFLALTHKAYEAKGDPEQGWMDRMKLRSLAQQIGCGTDSYFEAYCQLCAQNKNKTIFGEKTPRHIFKIAEILNRYPDAKVICMVRNPGGVIASYRDFWKSQWRSDSSSKSLTEKRRIKNSYNLIIISLIWKAALNAALKARAQFGESRVYIQQFENLVTCPESSLKSLTNWLSLDYEPSMHTVGLVNSSYSNSWSNGSGLSSEPAYRWQEKLSDAEVAIFQFCCGQQLLKAGYTKQPVRLPFLLILWLWITLPFAGSRALLANTNRINNIPQYVWRRLRLVIS
ncbi:sulfotransferase family protein [Chroogloeocystis siderophila]|jgi:hypothetical protein|uniref:Sulfotransferase family protein n=1 Tax=Chroogloeocystis siderophila 5.2 s.c.1 TaxID=247279 RepID=A0A1U7HYW3_9CHRO|nr:sulfotransferase [Chroogloeocystis siderophila]OKH28817.1 sulfotransferase family protein [Chroogloeocystis siderophila 5.2 s.c.1]